MIAAIFLLLPNNTYQWRFRGQHRTIKVAANNGSHCTLATRPLPSQQRQAPERACIAFSQISNHIYNQLIKMLEFFSTCFMPYNLDMRPLQGNHNMFCDIHIFFCNNSSRSVTFQHPRASNCRMLRPCASKFLRCFFFPKKSCAAFSCKNEILSVFLWYNVCNNFFS